jgi:putative addiction module component (TIGR02574 family)
MDIQTLERKALSLPATERARLAHELLKSLDALTPSELDALWLNEINNRLEAFDAGLNQATSAEEVAVKARALLK